jgi:hypothetical protein
MTEFNPHQAFVEHMLRYTVRLVRNPTTPGAEGGIGSGVLLQRPAGLVLLTAGHNFDRPGAWTLETDIVVGRQTLMLPIPNPQRLLQVDLETGESSNVDVAWARLGPRRLQGAPEPKGEPIALNVYLGPIDGVPSAEHDYGFATYSRVELHESVSTLLRDPAWEVEMTYEGVSQTGLHEFRLAGPHKGHDYYEGASGAPIADETGQIVSILVSGVEEENIVYGFPIHTVAELIDATTATWDDAGDR